MRRLPVCRLRMLLVCVWIILPGCCAHHGIVRIHGCSETGCQGCGAASHAAYPGPSEGFAGPAGEFSAPGWGPAADPLPPPGISRFHPVPTQPVFAPR